MQDELISFSVFKLELLKLSLFSFNKVYSTSTDFSFIKRWLRNLCIEVNVLPIEKIIKRKENMPHFLTKWELLDGSPIDISRDISMRIPWCVINRHGQGVETGTQSTAAKCFSKVSP